MIVADQTDRIESVPVYKLVTQEFFQHCRNALNPGGVFVNQAGSLSPPLVGPLARTAKTIGSVFRPATLISANVPTYGSQWGLVVASDRQFDALVDPSRIDQRLADSILGELRSLDGQAVLGHMQSPKYARERIASETVTYTLKNPPQLQRSRETAE